MGIDQFPADTHPFWLTYRFRGPGGAPYVTIPGGAPYGMIPAGRPLCYVPGGAPAVGGAAVGTNPRFREKAYLFPLDALICGLFPIKAYLGPRFRPKGMLLFPSLNRGPWAGRRKSIPFPAQHPYLRPLSKKSIPPTQLQAERYAF